MAARASPRALTGTSFCPPLDFPEVYAEDSAGNPAARVFSVSIGLGAAKIDRLKPVLLSIFAVELCGLTKAGRNDESL
jgi:hypothetical protein